MPSIIPTISAAGLGVLTLQPFPDVTPFTIREGATYESILSGIRVWIRDELVPYLNEHSADAIFQANIDTMIDTVNGALGDQAATVTAALNAAVQQVVTASVPFTSALFATMGFTVAPAPSGGDDTAALQELLLEAQNTSGTLYLRAGTYKANLATAQSFNQPKIIGAGKQYTKLAPFDKTKPAIIYQGGSGGESGGYLSDLSIVAHATGGGLGLALQDVCNVQWDRLRFDSLDEAIIFAVTQPGGFTEFCSGEATIQAGTGLALHYTTTKGAETSFHGSGLTNGIVNYSGPFAVQIEDQCFPYSAPLSATFFTHAADSQLIRNRNLHREVSFFGSLRVEHQAGGYVILGAVGAGHNPVLYVGNVSALNGPVRYGNFKELYDLVYVGGQTLKNRKPFTVSQGMGNGEIDFPLELEQGEFADVFINIIGPNFGYECFAVVWRNPNDAGGVVQKLHENLYNNTAGGGSATIAVQNGVLTITNAYQDTYTGTVTVAPRGSKITANAFRV